MQGSVQLPGSKSISNRALLLAALVRGNTVIENLPLADDVAVLLKTLPELGIRKRLARRRTPHSEGWQSYAFHSEDYV